MGDYYDLGNYSRAISTRSDDAQRWFDRGLNWCFGFNHEEAVACFKRALEADSECAMAWWGIAHASGCNYNKPWEAFDDEDAARSVAAAFEAAEHAKRLVTSATAVERALIDALSARYPQATPSDAMDKWNDAYADAMRKVHAAHGEDLDVASLFAEALMNRTPWALWDLASGNIADGADTAEAGRVLEAAMAREGGDHHPGLLHMYIHMMEMSPHPEKALKAADSLRDLVPDAGHLQHMPTHIDVLCGHYQTVVASNTAGIVADRKFLEREGALHFYSLYRCHNYHFKIYGAMFLGQRRPALEAADEMIKTLPEDLLKVESPPMADWLEGFIPMKMHVLIRFGMWQSIIDTQLPENKELFCTTTAMIHYAKGVAYAASGDVEKAERERVAFDEAVARVPNTRYVFNNTCLDILAVAAEMLKGELEYRKGNIDQAFTHLRRSVELDDSLPYDEPWGWMQPTRHALGALLLEQGRVEEALAVYRADLGLDETLARACQHPDNVWSLHGLHECLMRLGKQDEANHVKLRLDLAEARADEPIQASCYCRTTKAD